MKIGLIGAGNMASALLGGMLNAKIIQPGDAVISDMNEEKLKKWQEIGVTVTTDNQEAERRTGQGSEGLLFQHKRNYRQ